jgi:hypothetical protein
MKTETNYTFKLHLLWLMAIAVNGLAAAQQPSQADTDAYHTDPFGGNDEGRIGNWYSTHWFQHRDLLARGLADPMPEELPASRDTNGHWGSVVDGWQLSVRFWVREFVAGQPVEAMVLIRNVDSSPRGIVIRKLGASEACKNFSYQLHSGTNITSWAWTDSPPPNPLPNGYRFPKRFSESKVGPHSQIAFFVRLDQIFDLRGFGEYSIQVTRAERSSTGQEITNVPSGLATFRVVDKLSRSEIAASDARARELKETERRAREELSKPHERFLATNKSAFERTPPASDSLLEMTNKPSAK